MLDDRTLWYDDKREQNIKYLGENTYWRKNQWIASKLHLLSQLKSFGTENCGGKPKLAYCVIKKFANFSLKPQ